MQRRRASLHGLARSKAGTRAAAHCIHGSPIAAVHRFKKELKKRKLTDEDFVGTSEWARALGVGRRGLGIARLPRPAKRALNASAACPPPRAHCSFTILAKGLLGSPSMELLPEMALPAEVEEEEGAKGGAAAAAAADEEEL